MRLSLLLILCICNISTTWGQQEYALFDSTQILFDIPNEALPVSTEKRKHAFDSNFNPRYHSYLKEIRIGIPTDSTVETHLTQFHLQERSSEHLNFYFEYKIYLTHRDTLLLSTYRSYELLETGHEDTPTKFLYKPMLVKAYKLKGLKSFEEMSLPEVKPTDYAKTSKDSLIISEMMEKGELNFAASFEVPRQQEKGIYFSLNDLTLRTGPFEPPFNVTPKYFSDYKTTGRQIRFLVTSQGIIHEY